MISIIKQSIKVHGFKIKLVLIFALCVLIGASYIKVYSFGKSTERLAWEAKISKHNADVLTQRMKDLNSFNKALNKQEEISKQRIQLAEQKIEEFDNYVKSVKDSTSCLSSPDTEQLRKLWSD